MVSRVPAQPRRRLVASDRLRVHRDKNPQSRFTGEAGSESGGGSRDWNSRFQARLLHAVRATRPSLCSPDCTAELDARFQGHLRSPPGTCSLPLNNGPVDSECWHFPRQLCHSAARPGACHSPSRRAMTAASTPPTDQQRVRPCECGLAIRSDGAVSTRSSSDTATGY